MGIVAGVDFGTLSVRVSVVDSARGFLASAISEYPLDRKRDDPEYATQSHDDHMRALATATRQAVTDAGIKGEDVEAIALDTTGSSVVPVAADLTPLDDYYLWCDHRAKAEAAEITRLAHAEKLQAIQWCGGVYSSEWGFAKLLHWLRHNPDKRAKFASAFEHCDMVAATLCGITDPAKVKRSVCAMGHKWMWNPSLGGLPPESFLVKVDPLLAGVRGKLEGEYATSDQIAGRELSKGLEDYRAGQTGLLRLTWDNGDRTVLVNPNLGGITLGWNLQHTAQDELFAAIEGTAFHTRVILDRMSEYGAPTTRVINGGGIPQNNPVLNQVYANVLGRPVLVPSSKVTGMGSAIFAFLAAGTFKTIGEARDRICPSHKSYEPAKSAQRTYEGLYRNYRKLYFAFGEPEKCEFGQVLPELMRLAKASNDRS